MKLETDLSILIVNWNTCELITTCILSIVENPPNSLYEIILIDNGSTDNSVEMISRQFPQVEIIRNKENIGYSRAINLGIEKSHSKYILILNSDTIMRPEAINTLIKCSEINENTGIIGGKLLNQDLSFQASYNDFPNLWREFCLITRLSKIFYSAFYPSYPPEKSNNNCFCDWVGGACMLVRRDAIDNVGKMDENYFFYSEDVDWCYKMQNAGWKVLYCSNAEIIHLGGASAPRKSGRQLIRLYSSKVKFLEIRSGKFDAILFVIIVKIASFVNLLKSVILHFVMKTNNQNYTAYKELFLAKLR